ncbi:MAG: ABC transporter ATP-binding protein [Acidimicrobiales bacterium]
MVPAVAVEGVSKRFRLYHEKYTSLKERIIHMGHVPFEEFWALSDIEMEIGQGESVGLLGHNGSGKSTLLKCIAGILQPTKGRITVRGKLAAMLELGAGFHPELSGRDNIYLNASLLGMGKKEVARRFDEIVAFAELEQFIDNQIRFYSSGMQARLGFAVAVTFEPEVLLVDEVLAVGDESFQRKCLDRIKAFQTQGRTIVIVSHAPDQVRQICNRAFVLHHGHLVGAGPAGEAIRIFREHLRGAGEPVEGELAEVPPAGDPPGVQGRAPAGAPAPVVVAAGAGPAGAGQAGPDAGSARSDDTRLDSGRVVAAGVGGPPSGDDGGAPTSRPASQAGPGGRLRITQVGIHHDGAGARPYLLPGEPLSIRVGYEAAEPVDDAVLAVSLYDDRGELVYGTSTEILGQDLGRLAGSGQVTLDFESVPLLDGTYGVTLGMESAGGGEVYDWSEQDHHFEVMNPGRETGRVALPLTVRLQVDEPPAAHVPAAGEQAGEGPGPGEPPGEVERAGAGRQGAR